MCHDMSWRVLSSDWSCRYKGVGIVNGSPEKVWECLKPEPNGLRVKWDDNVKKFELLEQISQVSSGSGPAYEKGQRSDLVSSECL